MKFLQLSAVILALGGSCSQAASAADSNCPDKEATCKTRVQVDIATIVNGYVDEMPEAALNKFVEASAQCLQCVDKSNVKRTKGGDDDSGGGGSGNYICNEARWCRECGTRQETIVTCAMCCPGPRCMGCDFNLGPYYVWGYNIRACSDLCNEDEHKMPDDFLRRLAVEGEQEPLWDNSVVFKLDVCLADKYASYRVMLDDVRDQLHACYADKEAFMATWSGLCSDAGIDLPTLERGEERPVMFGLDEMDTEHAVVTTYSSDEAHRSSSHMLFYSALGFVTLSAFAVFGTAVVVRLLNRRKEAQEAQAAQWVSELTSVETANPVSPTAAPAPASEEA